MVCSLTPHRRTAPDDEMFPGYAPSLRAGQISPVVALCSGPPIHAPSRRSDRSGGGSGQPLAPALPVLPRLSFAIAAASPTGVTRQHSHPNSKQISQIRRHQEIPTDPVPPVLHARTERHRSDGSETVSSPVLRGTKRPSRVASAPLNAQESRFASRRYPGGINGRRGGTGNERPVEHSKEWWPGITLG